MIFILFQSFPWESLLLCRCHSWGLCEGCQWAFRLKRFSISSSSPRAPLSSCPAGSPPCASRPAGRRSRRSSWSARPPSLHRRCSGWDCGETFCSHRNTSTWNFPSWGLEKWELRGVKRNVFDTKRQDILRRRFPFTLTWPVSLSFMLGRLQERLSFQGTNISTEEMGWWLLSSPPVIRTPHM